MMTPEECRKILHQLGWSTSHYASMSAQDDRATRRQVAGQAPIPDAVAVWLRRLAVLATHPVMQEFNDLLDHPPRRPAAHERPADDHLSAAQ